MIDIKYGRKEIGNHAYFFTLLESKSNLIGYLLFIAET